MEEKLKGNTVTIVQPPIRWIGNKSRLIQKYRLWEYYPFMQHKRMGNLNHHYLYVELFCGSCCFFFNLKPNYAILNDHNHDLYNFFTVVQNDDTFPQFQSELSKIYCGNDWIEQYKPRTDAIGKALYFYLNNRFSNIGVQPMEFPKNFAIWKGIMDRCRLKILNEDALILLEQFNKSPFKPETNSTQYYIYEDPPYVDTEYMYKKTNEEPFNHERLSELNHASTHRIYITYNDHPLVRKLYADWHIMELETFSNITHKRRTDLWISNAPLKRYTEGSMKTQSNFVNLVKKSEKN